jgi:Pyruvate kinase, barrel domain
VRDYGCAALLEADTGAQRVDRSFDRGQQRSRGRNVSVRPATGWASKMRRLRRIKILATLGPASSDSAMIRKLFEAGADVFRT